MEEDETIRQTYYNEMVEESMEISKFMKKELKTWICSFR